MNDWHWLLISTLFFLGGFVYIAISLKTGRYEPSLLNMGIMASGFVCQCVFLYQRGQAEGRCPIANQYEILVFVSWSIVIFYFLVGRAFRLSLLGAFTAPLVSIFQLIALPNVREVPPRVEHVDYWLEMHVSVSLLSYGAFALACIAGVMFLVQDHFLKRAQLQNFSYNLPPVNYLAKAIVRLLTIGLALLTAGILSAFKMEEPPTALHLGLSLIVWLGYTGFMVVKFWRGLSSRQTALAAVGGFVLAVLLLIPLGR